MDHVEKEMKKTSPMRATDPNLETNYKTSFGPDGLTRFQKLVRGWAVRAVHVGPGGERHEPTSGTKTRTNESEKQKQKTTTLTSTFRERNKKA